MSIVHVIRVILYGYGKGRLELDAQGERRLFIKDNEVVSFIHVDSKGHDVKLEKGKAKLGDL